MPVILRRIEKMDNLPLAELIRNVFREFNIDKPGTVYDDPTTDNLFELFQTEKSAYWVAKEDGEILGGCGVFPTEGLPDGCGELVKFYLSTSARGKGIGKLLLQIIINSVKDLEYKQLYLESFPEFQRAVDMYNGLGFKLLDKPLGNSGHHACTIWMLKGL